MFKGGHPEGGAPLTFLERRRLEFSEQYPDSLQFSWYSIITAIYADNFL